MSTDSKVENGNGREASQANESPENPFLDSTVTRLYRHVCEYNSCPPRWSKFPANEEEQVDLAKNVTQDLIVHRHEYVDKAWVTKSFTIQDKAMQKLLNKALANYHDLDMALEEWTFKPPYRALVHRWDVLKDLQALAEGEEKAAADPLVEFLTPILAPSVESLFQTKLTGKVSFENVWQIFQPGEHVMTKFYGTEVVCRVLKYERICTSTALYWQITFEYVDWNGESCGYATTSTKIGYFGGFRRVTALPVYPLSFEDDASQIRERIIARGRKFEELRGYHFMTCDGKKVLLEEPEERPVSGRVVIDAFAYYLSCSIVKPELRSLFDNDRKPESTTTSTDSNDFCEVDDDDDEDEDEDDDEEENNGEVVEGPELTAIAMAETAKRSEDLRVLTDEQCLLATPWLKGLDLKTKEWGQFRIEDLKEIVWNDSAFENLVLPNGEKELAWAFVENKNLSNDAYDDFIADKGRGIIILMFGPPGVGKTYTAEAVAEKSRVPLYSISAGVLGTNPADVEKALDRALELCRLWNAMLLLDEADVFLGARTNDGLARNELISIFLTKLEYYQGILFLTTNRFSSIDHAFQSRIDLFLPYSDLTVAARRQVWENFMAHLGREKFDVDGEDLEKLSQVSLNGREIKNLIKSAQLLCFKSGEKVSTKRLYMLAENRVKALKMLGEDE